MTSQCFTHLIGHYELQRWDMYVSILPTATPAPPLQIVLGLNILTHISAWHTSPGWSLGGQFASLHTLYYLKGAVLWTGGRVCNLLCAGGAVVLQSAVRPFLMTLQMWQNPSCQLESGGLLLHNAFIFLSNWWTVKNQWIIRNHRKNNNNIAHIEGFSKSKWFQAGEMTQIVGINNSGIYTGPHTLSLSHTCTQQQSNVSW